MSEKNYNFCQDLNDHYNSNEIEDNNHIDYVNDTYVLNEIINQCNHINSINNDNVNNDNVNNDNVNNDNVNNDDVNNDNVNDDVNNDDVNNENNLLVKFEKDNDNINSINNENNLLVQFEKDNDNINIKEINGQKFIECDVNFKGVNLLNYEKKQPDKLPNKDIKNLNKQVAKYRIYMCVCGTEEQNFLNASLSIKSFRDNGFKGPIDILTDDIKFKPFGVTNVIYVPKSDISIYSALKLKPFDYLTINKDEILIYVDNTILNLRPLTDIYLTDKIAVCGIFDKKENIKSHKITNAVSFNTSIFAFRPSAKVKNLFTAIWNEYILSRKNKNQFEKPYTHPYIIKNLLINDMVDYSLTQMVLNDINKNQINSTHIFGNFTKESILEKQKILEYLSQTNQT